MGLDGKIHVHCPAHEHQSFCLHSFLYVLASLLIGREEKYQKDADPWRKECRQKRWCSLAGQSHVFCSKPWFGGFCSTLDIVSSIYLEFSPPVNILKLQLLVPCEIFPMIPSRSQLSGLLSLKEQLCCEEVKSLNVRLKGVLGKLLMRLILCIRKFAAFEQWYMSKQSTLLLLMTTLVCMQTLSKWLGNQLPRASFSFHY